jgi:hypothetical protein
MFGEMVMNQVVIVDDISYDTSSIMANKYNPVDAHSE